MYKVNDGCRPYLAFGTEGGVWMLDAINQMDAERKAKWCLFHQYGLSLTEKVDKVVEIRIDDDLQASVSLF